MMDGIAAQIWDMKYRLKGPDGFPIDRTLEDSWMRVANALSVTEEDPAFWSKEFYSALEDFKFLPAGRIIAGAGSDRQVTLFNCFVMGTIPDDMVGIFENLKEAALTMQQGGGIGYDFSSLRPKGAIVKGVCADASGPLPFMDVWDAMCRTIMSAGYRRGAMMATMRCDHPDIEDFISAKQEAGRLNMFNLSVLITDPFMDAVKNDDNWDLVFAGKTHRSIGARDLWDCIMQSTYEAAEPGVIFIDRINRLNNLYYCEDIKATNPCGEQPLPPYGACDLGSINLARLVHAPFTPEACLDEAELARIVPLAVRMLDNVIDVSTFPLETQAKEAKSKRRIGLGVTGLADALIMCRVRYGSPEAIGIVGSWMEMIQRLAYLASVELAAEKGAFPLFDGEAYLAGDTIMGLDEDIRQSIKTNGIRNGLLTSIAPTGTISLLAGNVSSGIEPVFSYEYQRDVISDDGTKRPEAVTDYAYSLFRTLYGLEATLPSYFVDAAELKPEDHLVMQAAVQEFVDSSISKTINLPKSIPFESFKDVYAQAYQLDCKGCTTYRPNDITGAVLKPNRPKPVHEIGDGGVVYMAQPLERPSDLGGSTYKIRWAHSDHAIYITVNDIEKGGRRRPFEVFINSKNMEHYAWTVALTRMISAVFRRGGDVVFVVEELKAVFDPRGGQWVDGRYVPSLLAAIGEVIERHLISIGFMTPDDQIAEVSKREQAVGDDHLLVHRRCPKCGSASLIHEERCDRCVSCGYSKCS
ncbi:adenosylcobalamin-dependent ribonucleoside-diphosphate reductase [Alphaproteobacteria bacterium]|jgi:ribonucleoside-diphosphate reductase alpha chain|nr:adenosylcobalamin-dependent ribonucleoside-diphosphate reductase [Alphaproteobacteria bacterium]